MYWAPAPGDASRYQTQLSASRHQFVTMFVGYRATRTLLNTHLESVQKATITGSIWEIF